MIRMRGSHTHAATDFHLDIVFLGSRVLYAIDCIFTASRRRGLQENGRLETFRRERHLKIVNAWAALGIQYLRSCGCT
jgi:hypothetical protein